MNDAANDNRLGLHFSALKMSARVAVEKAEAYLQSARDLEAADGSANARAIITSAETTLEKARQALASLLAAEQLVLSEAPEAVY